MVIRMSRANFCRLCVKVCKDYKPLYDDIEVYEITAKYFDPMFLNEKQHLTVICLDCWCKMLDFHSYQESVLQAQTRLNGHQDDQSQHDIPPARLCRLCVNRGKDLTRFVENLEIYEIVIKYFDPAFLNIKVLTGICLECWSQIFDFHKFQESVIHAQRNTAVKEEEHVHCITVKSEMSEFHDQLPHCNQVYETSAFTNVDDTIKDESYEVFIKSEVPELLECSNVEASRAFCKSDHVIKEETELFSRPELELIDVHIESQFSSNAEMPTSGYVIREIETPAVNKRTCMGKEGGETNQSRECTIRTVTMDYDYDSSNDDENYNQTQKSSNQSKTERKKTVQELDVFIAQWRPSLECVICSISCSTFSLLQKHFDTQHPTEQCHIFCCQCKFKSHYYIEEHIRFHLDPNIFKCQICGQRNTTKLNLKRHMEYWHSAASQQTAASLDKNSLVCCECGKSAKTSGALRKHMQRHEAKRKFKCAICDKGFRGRNDLRTHLATHMQNPCPYCPMTFKYLSMLNRHKTTEHGP